MYIEKWNNSENLIEQYRLNSNFDDENHVYELNNFIKENYWGDCPVKVKEYSEGHNVLTLELPFFVLICECCYSLSLNFYTEQKNNLTILKTKFQNYDAFRVSFGENTVYCELLEIRIFGKNKSS